MQGGVVDAGNGDFAIAYGNEGGLVDQEGDLVAVGEFAVLVDWHATVVIMVAQGHIDRCNLPQAGEKSEQVRQSLWHIEQVAGDKNPVGAKFANGGEDEVMSWLITVEMEIAQMSSPPSSQESMSIGESGNLVCGEPDFQVGNETKEPIKGLTEIIADDGTGLIRPGSGTSIHPITRSSSTRSEGVTR